VRAIIAAAKSSPAVASRRAKYFDDTKRNGKIRFREYMNA
jgi:hypothetical protein